MPKVQCAVVGCYNGSYRLDRWKSNFCDEHKSYKGFASCICTPPFELFPFPTESRDPASRKVWIQQINRKDTKSGKIWLPKPYDRVCSEHFIDKHPTAAHPFPTENLGYSSAKEIKVRRKISKVSPKKKPVKPQAQPVVECPSVAANTPDVTGSSQCTIYQHLQKQPASESLLHLCPSPASVRPAGAIKHSMCDKLLKDDKDVKYYTGIPDTATWNLLWDYVKDKVKHMNYWHGSRKQEKRKQNITVKSPAKKLGRRRKLDQRDELLMTLMKLRLGLQNKDLADRFRVPCATVSSVFGTWVKVLADSLKETIQLPSSLCIKANLPQVFRHSRYCNVRGILDCTEIFIERPRNLNLQAATWSDYKKHNTVKVLVVITPRGRIGFLSEAWGGRATDVHITRHSGFLDLVEEYDSYMADRGFPIAADLLERRAELLIPPGARGTEQMTPSQVEKTQMIANLRIHVERAIGRLKIYRIFTGILPITLLPLIDDMLKCCAGLCNLQDPLVK